MFIFGAVFLFLNSVVAALHDSQLRLVKLEDTSVTKTGETAYGRADSCYGNIKKHLAEKLKTV